LQVVEPGGGGAPAPNIELLAPALTLGRDGAVAETIFHDRSVSRLHARLVQEDGSYRIFDSGSTSGTWVNYTPIPSGAGHLLQDGDLINLGRVQLRYQRRDLAAAGSPGPRVALVTPATAAATPAAALQPLDPSQKDSA
jgi:pSer/pThr/pTyr-binding forkhead associated (FHA) protein